MSLSRTTAVSFTKSITACLAAIAALAAIVAGPAAATTTVPSTPAVQPPAVGAPESVSAELAVCPGQSFAQSFLALGDANYYTLVPGSQFDAPGEGWELRNGASIVTATRPDASAGGVLDLPSGAVAVSPPVCVTLQYPSARTWIEDVQGGGGVAVGVFYAGTRWAGLPVGFLTASQGDGWELSRPFDVRPQLAGGEEGVREVRFVFANVSKGSDFHLSGLYVDPRMS